MTEPAVRLIPLGGLGEIGLNMMLVEFGDDLIAVDCGLMFPDPDELPGIDYVIPDFSYALAKRENFRAVFLTHGHEDHIGALPYLLREARVPVYGTPMTLGLVAERLREHDLLEGAELRAMRPRDRIEAGPFRVEPIRVTHSIVDGIGLAIDTPVGTLVHTGDFKLDPSPLDGEPPDYLKFAELGEQGVLVLCSDSTNVDRPGHTRSEMEVGAALRERFARATGRIILATFASHIHRIQQVLTLAAEHGRRVALVGMSMQRNVALAAELGYLRIPSQVLLPLEELALLPLERQVILSTGSQGEPNSALALMAAGEHRAVQIERGDLVIVSARVIPGHERTVGRVINALLRLGAEVLYEDNAFVHVSGHASQEDLKLMLTLTRPRYFIPVHGEYRHLLGHARLAASVGLTPDRIFLLEDGLGLEVTKTAARVVGRYPVGRVLVDGKGIGDIGAVVLRDRQLLAQDGLVAVSLVVNREGKVVAGPEIATRGFVHVKENEPLLEELRASIRAALAARIATTPVDREAIGALVRTTVRHFINQRFQRKPVVLPVVLEV
ncbi:MAG: ribonuclease J [Candidatus Rokubacteria bacterium 13_1_40CM_69_27]|nr:MAG: ribonuclease J [Candidatus Rokubacteria bacterium 13_1_40CM_69_27]OLC37858.1 MAG: ribonuclease J [Candidatus Rokubacteria bacterium 13_1_40CM_4_69_5]